VGQRRSTADPTGLPPVRVTSSKGGVVAPSGAAAPPVLAPWDRGAAQPHRGPIATSGGRTIGRSVGMNTLMGIVDGVSRRERRRSAVLVAGVAMVIIAVALWMTQRSKPVDWIPIAERVSPSVCVVMYRLPGQEGAEVGFGTAWSVGDGVFATNAHVAEKFHEGHNGRPVEVIIRTPGSNPQDMRVESVTLHPGYQEWADLLDKYNPYDIGARRFLQQNSFHPCDIALMYIAKEDQRMQPEPLKLASSRRSGRVRPGMDLMICGYPMEGGILNFVNPAPYTRSGSLSTITDAFLRGVEPDLVEFLQYSWPSAGGASGSPVFNSKGEVVGLLSAGAVIGVIDGVRVPASAGAVVGPHVRLLKELLDGTAAIEQAKRSAEWEEQMLHMIQRLGDHADSFAEVLAELILAGSGELDPERHVIERIERREITLEIRGGRGTQRVGGLRVAPGANVVVAVSRDRPTNLWLFFDGTDAPLPDTLNRTWDFHLRSVDRGQTIGATIQSARGSVNGDTQVVVFVFAVRSR